MSEPTFFTTRREFLTGGLTFLSAAGTLPIFLGHTANVLADPGPRRKKRDDSKPVLVVIQLAGGNDGLNTVVPYRQDAYYKHRPTLAIPKKDVLKLGQGVGLHPAATGLKSLFDDGMLAIVQGVGYPNPNRSHFTSTDIWSTADPKLKIHEGWLGRYFDACCKGSDAGSEPIEGIALTKETPLAMQGDRFVPLSFENPDALTWRAGQRDERAAAAFRKLNNVGAAPGNDHDDDDEPVLARYLQRAALKAQVGADEIRAAAGHSRGGRTRGRSQLDRSLQLVARMIASDLPTRVYYVSMGGFDTHTGQAGRQQRLLAELGNGLKSFVDTLKKDKLLERVLIMSFSEFGRRVEQNASGGTDHGEAAPMFVIGSKLRPGLHEKHPSLSRLHRGDLSFGCDFRRVYASVLRDWLKVKPETVLRGKYPPLRLIKTT